MDKYRQKDPKVIKFRKPKAITEPQVLDQILRREQLQRFHPSRYFDATIEVPCSQLTEKTLSRMIITIDRPITGLNLARTTMVQFVPRTTSLDNGLLKIRGDVIADVEIPRLIAIKIIRENIEDELTNETSSK